LAPAADGVVATGQTVRPAGQVVAFSGRPVDLAISPDGRTVFVKNNKGIVILDVKSWTVKQELPYDQGSSMHGIAVSRDGRRVYLTTASGGLVQAIIGQDGKSYWGKSQWGKSIDMPKHSFPCGFALSADERWAYVALCINNSVAIVDLAAGKVAAEVKVGVAPFDVALSPDGSTAYVSNWGGRVPGLFDRKAKGAGADTLVDERGIPCSGTVSKIDLAKRKVVAQADVGLHPSGLVRNGDGSRLYVANANSDTVSVIDTKDFRVVETIPVRPDEALPFGSITCGLALGKDERTLFAANGGNNAVAVIALGQKSELKGFIPAGWFPGAVATDGERLFIVNIKGDGQPPPSKPGQHAYNSRVYRGSVSKVDLPSDKELEQYTQQARVDAMVPQSLQATEKAQDGVKAVPVPPHVGEPSVFKHVVYVLKENRTYDQILGDMKQGNGDPHLCVYGRQVTPNHHAIAEQFVLLDNYYCNGVISADGHQWATQGITNDYNEKTFGGFSRNYFFGIDPLAFAPTNFIWDSVLLHGLSFRNYGEFAWPGLEPAKSTWIDAYTGKARIRQTVSLEPLQRYTDMKFPGWDLRIPDKVRMDRFIEEFRKFEKDGHWPNLVFVYLPQDHTFGRTVDAPTPRACIADNDLAVGRLVEAISKSRYWPDTCIFVNEDDPQDGFDHVDGHRSLCLVASAYTKRAAVVSHFYNQTAVLHTIERILGLEPMNQLDALAPTMEDCFTDKPDLAPYEALKNNIPLDEMNKVPASMPATAPKPPPGEPIREPQHAVMNFTRPDLNNDDEFNRLLWLDAKGPDEPYPAQFAGAHGRGLKALHLQLQKDKDKDKDDDD
jgi:YVTN family beta-propeller protein